MITIFEVHYDPENRDDYQTRIIQEKDWDTYIENVKSERLVYPSGLTKPRGVKINEDAFGNERLEFDYIVPATGKLMRHKSWKVQIADRRWGAIESFEKVFDIRLTRWQKFILKMQYIFDKWLYKT